MSQAFKNEIYIPAILIPSMAKVAARIGLNVPRLLEMAGLDESIFEATDEVTPFSNLNHLMNAMLELSQLPSIGLYIGTEIAFDYFPDFERFITTAGTGREAIRALTLFENFCPFFHFSLKEKPSLQEAHLIISMTDECPENLQSVYIEMFSSIIHRFGKAVLGDKYSMKKLILGSRLNAPLFEYKKIFNVPVEAGAIGNAVILDLEILDMTLINALPTANEKAEQGLRELIRSAMDQHGYKAKLLRLMRSDILIAKSNISEVSDLLNISVRSLQRKLQNEQATFSEIQLEARMEFAIEKLINTTIQIEAISEFLGFSNRRSFSRAFNDWYASTPSNYRKRELAMQKKT